VDRTVRIWDVATWRERTRLTGHTGRVNAVAVAPDGRWVATASYDRAVRIWDVATRRERTQLTGHTDRVNAGAGAPGCAWLGAALGRQRPDDADLGHRHR